MVLFSRLILLLLHRNLLFGIIEQLSVLFHAPLNLIARFVAFVITDQALKQLVIVDLAIFYLLILSRGSHLHAKYE